MASVVGVHGNAGQCNYSASKAGMIGLAKSIAQALGSRCLLYTSMVQINNVNLLTYINNVQLNIYGSIKDKS